MLRAAWTAPARVAAHLERSAILQLAIDDGESFIFYGGRRYFGSDGAKLSLGVLFYFLVVGNVAVFSS